MSNGSMIVRERGKRALIPVTNKKVLIGILAASRTRKFTGPELNLAKKSSGEIARIMQIGGTAH
jgi:hypothetical protein